MQLPIELKRFIIISAHLVLKVSVEYGLDFKVVDLDINYKLEGKATVYDLQFNKLEYEYIPSLYFINGLRCSNDNRLAFLSYYQVIEYFSMFQDRQYNTQNFVALIVSNLPY